MNFSYHNLLMVCFSVALTHVLITINYTIYMYILVNIINLFEAKRTGNTFFRDGFSEFIVLHHLCYYPKILTSISVELKPTTRVSSNCDKFSLFFSSIHLLNHISLFHLQYRSAFILLRRSKSVSCNVPSFLAFFNEVVSSLLMRNFLS